MQLQHAITISQACRYRTTLRPVASAATVDFRWSRNLQHAALLLSSVNFNSWETELQLIPWYRAFGLVWRKRYRQRKLVIGVYRCIINLYVVWIETSTAPGTVSRGSATMIPRQEKNVWCGVGNYSPVNIHATPLTSGIQHHSQVTIHPKNVDATRFSCDKSWLFCSSIHPCSTAKLLALYKLTPTAAPTTQHTMCPMIIWLNCSASRRSSDVLEVITMAWDE